MATGLEILIDIHRVANQLSVRDADGFSSRDYEREGNYSLKVIISEFGSWNQAKKHVGLETMQSTRRVSDADLLGDLRRVAKQLGTSRITVEQYSDKGRYGEATIRQRFGNWVTALQKSGLDTETPSPHYTYSEDALLDDLRHIAKSMKKDTVTQGDYRTNRGPKMASAQTIKARFDTWNKALKRAGLRPNSPGGYPRHTREEAARALVGVILRAGPRPTMAEYASNKPSEAPNASSVMRALSARGWDEAINRANEYMKTGSLPAGGPRTPRKPNEALKKEIWERAKGRCENPGCPSEYPTIPRGFFHFDHKKSWGNGGETILENMQLLCRSCNLAKGSE